MAYDLVIRNGTVVDGSGAPGRIADVGIAEGRIAEIGRIADAAERIIDAEGRVVAPGFIDPHTHYDAQICWDRAITPSIWHGVTSVVMGNCGVGIAPCKPAAREVDARPRQCRGHPVRRSRPGHHLGVGELSRIPRRRGPPRRGAQSRLPRAADPVSPLRDGRSLA